MLLIAISFGFNNDPFTCSTTCDESAINPKEAGECLCWVCNDKNLHPGCVDEVLVVIDNAVKYHHRIS